MDFTVGENPEADDAVRLMGMRLELIIEREPTPEAAATALLIALPDLIAEYPEVFRMATEVADSL